MGKAATPGDLKGYGQAPRLKPCRVWVASGRGLHAAWLRGTTVGTEGSRAEDVKISEVGLQRPEMGGHPLLVEVQGPCGGSSVRSETGIAKCGVHLKVPVQFLSHVIT